MRNSIIIIIIILKTHRKIKGRNLVGNKSPNCELKKKKSSYDNTNNDLVGVVTVSVLG